MELVGITVSVNYADLLAICLEANAPQLDRIVVVTVATDRDTLDVCARHPDKVRPLLSESLHKDGAAFNKSALVREAQELVHGERPDAWVVLLDSDIALPPGFRAAFERLDPPPDPAGMHTLERYDYHSKHDYDHKRNGRKYHHRFAGYVQIYRDKTKLYPPSSKDCSWCDLAFADLFKAKTYLPLPPCSHLGAGYQNWSGRTTTKW